MALERYNAAVAGSDETEGRQHWWANGAKTEEERVMPRGEAVEVGAEPAKARL